MTTGTRVAGFVSSMMLGLLVCPVVNAADAPPTLGSFGPTGVEIAIQRDLSMKVTGVQAGSPAEGRFEKGQVITSINSRKLPADPLDQAKLLSELINSAEGADGVLKFAVDGNEVEIKIPVLGVYGKTWPVDCEKSRKIIRSHAGYLARLAKEQGLGAHTLYDGLAILALLSTGEESDLEVVRGIYAKRMNGFASTDTGAHSWHNGYQGIAACEYYLRTGDKSVIPLINAICESARKWQVHGGWTHWATSVNTQYTAGGLMNPAGTNILTTLLLARHCGAKVDEGTLQRALLLFYRFAGHGSNPYGDHRPEAGYGSNNGKTEMLAMAMQAASLASNGKSYELARDKCAMNPLNSYRDILRGHTGPMGAMWHAPAAALLIDKKPDLYRNKMDETRWLIDLSRRHDGSFGMSRCGRYDIPDYGHSLMLALTAPLKTLRITGAPRSKFGVDFQLPALPWGRQADLAFFNIDGGPKYGGPTAVPHLEQAAISKASAEELERFAQHPEHVCREFTADALRAGKHHALIEKLLGSPCPQARHTACMALNNFQPWQVSSGSGWLSAKSISPDDFTPAMFNALIGMVRKPDEALWLVDSSMIALALAKPEQTKEHLDLLMSYLEHEDWWLNESAAMALSPALRDPEALGKILPGMVKMIARNEHIKGRSFVEWMLTRTAAEVPVEMRKQISMALQEVFVKTPTQKSVEGDMGRIGISSCLLADTLRWTLAANPELAPEMAKLSLTRLNDMRERERGATMETLIQSAQGLEGEKRKEAGAILTKHYRSAIVAGNREFLDPAYTGPPANRVDAVNRILQIDELAGVAEGWKFLDASSDGSHHWYRQSFEPAEKLDSSDPDRYREVSLPKEFEGWNQPGFKPAAKGWEKVTKKLGTKAPAGYVKTPEWDEAGIKNAGEVIFLHKTFEIDDPEQAMLRLIAFSRQGYRIYLNGHLVAENKGRSKTWQAHVIYADSTNKIAEHLKKGTNVIAATSFLQYFRGKEGAIEVYVEGLKKLPEID
jgi:Family of unknown function (DUF6288)